MPNLIPFIAAVMAIVLVVLFTFQITVFTRLLKSGKAGDAFAYVMRTRALAPAVLPAALRSSDEEERNIPTFDDDSFGVM